MTKNPEAGAGEEVSTSPITLREPVSEDGIHVNRMIASCPPLDTNSVYCNLLQCDHFAATSVAAHMDGELVGFISGYLIPDREEPTLFIWQVAVREQARGHGLAGRMMLHILQRDVCRGVHYLETTITRDNEASWALFKGFASRVDAATSEAVHYDSERHFDGEHNSEWLLRIGPFNISD